MGEQYLLVLDDPSVEETRTDRRACRIRDRALRRVIRHREKGAVIGQPSAVPRTTGEMNSAPTLLSGVSLGRPTVPLPLLAVQALPGMSSVDPHYRIRHDKVDAAGKVSLRFWNKMLHLGIGRP